MVYGVYGLKEPLTPRLRVRPSPARPLATLFNCRRPATLPRQDRPSRELSDGGVVVPYPPEAVIYLRGQAYRETSRPWTYVQFTTNSAPPC